MQPHEYSRRILLAVTGLSPQIATETIYALAMPPHGEPEFTPTEVHLITTKEGADHARLTLLSDEPGWFHQLCRDYNLKDITFNEEQIHILKDENGQPLDDIRTPLDNENAANYITELVRKFTDDDDAALHVSLAGGRKTMGFYLGYALSLFGRRQDRLSHVLVSKYYESHPEFFYPTPSSNIIFLKNENNRPLDTKDAKITLASIPFVSMRHGLTNKLTKENHTFHECVSMARLNLGEPELIIDLKNKLISCGGKIISLTPAIISFYSMLARRTMNKLDNLPSPHNEGYSIEHGEAFLNEYNNVKEEEFNYLKTDDFKFDKTAKGLILGMNRSFFDQRKTEIKSSLKKELYTDDNVAMYAISSTGKRTKEYFINLKPSQISYSTLSIKKDES